jgi:arsenite methyltransferase
VPDRVRDRWAEWVLDRSFGGDRARRAEGLGKLAEVRDRVLDSAELEPGQTLIDVGAGDGLIGFGALERVMPQGRVVFSDVSGDLLAHCRLLADELGVSERCEFVLASADDLEPIEGESVDAVTTRSVLIYLDREGKRRAFEEFHRVLRAGGRLSIFEPINSFGSPEPAGWFLGYDLRPIAHLAARVVAACSPEEERTLTDFDERELLGWAEGAGFDPIRLRYEVDLEPGSWLAGSWETVLRTSGNPLMPTVGEALDEALTADERAVFEAHLRPLVETNAGRRRAAVAYLSAAKPTLGAAGAAAWRRAETAGGH